MHVFSGRVVYFQNIHTALNRLSTFYEFVMSNDKYVLPVNVVYLPVTKNDQYTMKERD